MVGDRKASARMTMCAAFHTQKSVQSKLAVPPCKVIGGGAENFCLSLLSHHQVEINLFKDSSKGDKQR